MTFETPMSEWTRGLIADLFIDIGFTLMGGPSFSPPKKIGAVLGLPETSMGRLSEVVFTENHETTESLIASVEKGFNLRVNDVQRSAIVEFWNRQTEDVYELEGALPLMRRLKENRVNIHIVSNLWYPFYEKFNDVFEEVVEYISTWTLSFRDGIRKPSPGFYKLALERSGADPRYSIMLGDSVSKDIVPFAEVGMECIWFISRPHDSPQLAIKREKLSKFQMVSEADSLKDAEKLIMQKISPRG